MKPPASLVQVKGNWYVQITVPPEHRERLNGKKQLRQSTGTSDKRSAEKLKHDIAQKLYHRLPDQIEELKAKLDELSVPEWMPRIAPIEVDLPPLLSKPLDWYSPEQVAQIEELKAKIKILEAERSKSSIKLKDLAEQWLASRPYPLTKTTKEADSAIQEFLTEHGYILVADLSATTGYRWAEKLGEEKGNKTIRKKIGYVSRCLQWGTQKGLVTANPFFGLSLSGYGTKTTSFRPFSKEELNRLFALKIPDHLRLLLGILITTGMRLDEAALLNWEDVKEQDGRQFFDLTGKEKIVKNIGSQRLVPVPDCLDLEPKGTGPMFPQFKRNADGKAQGPSSKALMALIREVTDDPQKVVHSLRGTLKDLLRDAGVDKETNDFITGHGSGDVSGKYGSGPSLKTRAEALNRVVHPYLKQV